MDDLVPDEPLISAEKPIDSPQGLPQEVRDQGNEYQGRNVLFVNRVFTVLAFVVAGFADQGRSASADPAPDLPAGPVLATDDWPNDPNFARCEPGSGFRLPGQRAVESVRTDGRPMPRPGGAPCSTSPARTAVAPFAGPATRPIPKALPAST